MQISIDEDLKDYTNVCFQAAILYTSPNGERRIRVHTLSLPVVTILADVIHSADQEAIIGLVSKMAVDRSLTTSISDAREALINSVVDILNTYRTLNTGSVGGALLSSHATRLMPLYVLSLIKHVMIIEYQKRHLNFLSYISDSIQSWHIDPSRRTGVRNGTNQMPSTPTTNALYLS